MMCTSPPPAPVRSIPLLGCRKSPNTVPLGGTVAAPRAGIDVLVGAAVLVVPAELLGADAMATVVGDTVTAPLDVCGPAGTPPQAASRANRMTRGTAAAWRSVGPGNRAADPVRTKDSAKAG